MALDLIFSFLLNTWQSFPGTNSWAEEHLQGVDIVAEIKKEEQILCSLERQRLLAYDARWKKRDQLEIPKECQDLLKHRGALQEVEFRSQSLASPEKKSAWNHRIDVKTKEGTPFTLFVRYDGKYVGAHSTAGWSMWVERKTGHVRYEWTDFTKNSHFRMKAQVAMNPVKGNVTKLGSLAALYVRQEAGILQKAVFVTEDSVGYRHVVYLRSGTEWKKTLERCTRKKGCQDPLEVSLEETKLSNFGNVATKSYGDYIEKGHPLAFIKIDVDEVVPPTDNFR